MPMHVLRATYLTILSLKSLWYLAKCQEQSWPIMREAVKKGNKKKKLFCLLLVSNIIQASLLWKKAEESRKRATLSEKEFYGGYLTHRKCEVK